MAISRLWLLKLQLRHFHLGHFDTLLCGQLFCFQLGIGFLFLTAICLIRKVEDICLDVREEVILGRLALTLDDPSVFSCSTRRVDTPKILAITCEDCKFSATRAASFS